MLASAGELFVTKGYVATTIADIARHARVAVDTVYATVGRKPALLREVLESALSGTDAVVPAEQRDYVKRSQQAARATDKITAYVEGLVRLQSRLAPVFLVVRDASGIDPDSAVEWTRIAERRARNMRMFAADLRTTGELRDDLSDAEVADIIWSMNVGVLATSRRRSRLAAGAVRTHLVDAWTRILLS